MLHDSPLPDSQSNKINIIPGSSKKNATAIVADVEVLDSPTKDTSNMSPKPASGEDDEELLRLNDDKSTRSPTIGLINRTTYGGSAFKDPKSNSRLSNSRQLDHFDSNEESNNSSEGKGP